MASCTSSGEPDVRTAREALVWERVRASYCSDDPGHDIAHVVRVIASARRLCAAVGAREEIVVPAGLLHDVVNVPKDDPNRLGASSAAAELAMKILCDAGYQETESMKIREVIVEHSYSLGLKATSIESQVLQDADRLDALGAIGVLRAATCGCRLRSSYYDLVEPFPLSRPVDDHRYTIDHFYSKLLGLPERFNTEVARQEAYRRVRFMNLFLDQLREEIIS